MDGATAFTLNIMVVSLLNDFLRSKNEDECSWTFQSLFVILGLTDGTENRRLLLLQEVHDPRRYNELRMGGNH